VLSNAFSKTGLTVFNELDGFLTFGWESYAGDFKDRFLVQSGAGATKANERTRLPALAGDMLAVLLSTVPGSLIALLAGLFAIES
jgi:hypothetical protein